jgi:uncharacterized coiled-coil protein SlyX
VARVGDREWTRTLLAQLQQRGAGAVTDPTVLLESFRQSGAGGRVIEARGDGQTLDVWIPAEDGYEPPETLELTPFDQPANVLLKLERQDRQEVEGIGTLVRFSFKPIDLKSHVPGDRPQVGLRGEGLDGAWSPLGVEGAVFAEDLEYIIDLALHGGMDVRPDVETARSEGRWVKLTDAERSAVERSLGRKVPRVVRREVLEDARLSGQHDGGVIDGAMQSVRGATGAEAAEGSDAVQLEQPLREALREVLGQTWENPDELTGEAVALAIEVLEDQRAGDAAKTLQDALDGKSVEEDDLVAAFDQAFGYGFTSSKAPTVALVDALIDFRAEGLGANTKDLRQLRATLAAQERADLFGIAAERSVQDQTSPDKRAELAQALGSGLDVAPTVTDLLAEQVLRAANVPSTRPTVLVLTGERGSAADVLYQRVKNVLGAPASEIQGAAELRGGDPVGYLVGSPGDRPGVAKSALVRAGEGAPRRTFYLDGTDLAGASVDEAQRESAQAGLWNMLAAARRDGFVQAYDPSNPERRAGFRFELGQDGTGPANQAVFVVRDARGVEALRKSMTAEAWAQLSPHVLDCGAPSAEATITQTAEALAEMAKDQFGVEVKVEFGASARAFLTELVESGLSPVALEEHVADSLLRRMYFAGESGDLAAKIRVEMTDGLTPKDVQRFKAAWAEGSSLSLPGVGESPLELRDAGTTEVSTLDPRVQARRKRDAELDALRGTLAEYQLSATTDAAKIRQLTQNFARAQEQLAEAGEVNTRARARVEALTLLNREANELITSLKGDVDEANKRIETLNASLALAKDKVEEINSKLELAVGERDRIIDQLRQLERDFNQTEEALLRAPPQEVFQLAARAAQGGAEGERFAQRALEYGARQALNQAAALAQSYDRWRDIAALAREYVEACVAVGTVPDAQVLLAFAAAAAQSGKSMPVANAHEEFWRDIGISNAGALDRAAMEELNRNLSRRQRRRI